MDYTVGSLADLISGHNTPNKPKVKKIRVKTKADKDEKQIATQEAAIEIQESKSKKRKSRNKQIVSEEAAIEIQANKPKKRKSIDKHTKKNKKRKVTENTLADSDVEGLLDEPVIDSDNSAEKKKKVEKEKIVQTPEEAARTIYVGNVPITTEKKIIKKHFKRYGPIESLRFRGIPVANPKVSKKIAVMKNEFHPNRHSVYCFIKFVNKEDAKEALAEDGVLFEEHHIHVAACDIKVKPDESRAIFIGNLSFDAEEEELWKLFETCGPISHVRIVRHSDTGMGKGFAYVNFKESDAVQLALEMENVQLRKRPLRIKLSSVSSAKKNKKNQKLDSKPRWRNRQKNNQNNTRDNSQGGKNQWNKSDNIQNKDFQGSKFNLKKKNKVNRGLLKKKINIKKVAPIAK